MMQKNVLGQNSGQGGVGTQPASIEPLSPAEALQLLGAGGHLSDLLTGQTRDLKFSVIICFYCKP